MPSSIIDMGLEVLIMDSSRRYSAGRRARTMSPAGRPTTSPSFLLRHGARARCDTRARSPGQPPLSAPCAQMTTYRQMDITPQRYHANGRREDLGHQARTPGVPPAKLPQQPSRQSELAPVGPSCTAFLHGRAYRPRSHVGRRAPGADARRMPSGQTGRRPTASSCRRWPLTAERKTA